MALLCCRTGAELHPLNALSAGNPIIHQKVDLLSAESACFAEQGVSAKIHDPLYTPEEIKNLSGAETFTFPGDLRDFDTIVIVSGHREYRTIDHVTLLDHLEKCRLVIDNTALWKGVDFQSKGIEYHLTGDANWLGSNA